MRAEDTASAATHRYQPQVDGLRAIAVLLVVFYHARAFGLDNGFVGVEATARHSLQCAPPSPAPRTSLR